MDNNRTNVPGLGNNMYNRSASTAPDKGTVVPGMHEQAPGVEPTAAEKRRTAPVVGFLYSISRNGVGEYWPVCIGQNTIGRDAVNDVVLLESTVSNRHALLNVKQLKQTKRLVAQIRDEGSKNGIVVNGEELDFGIHECKNGDIIRIGDNYTLLLILIEAEAMGLSIAEEFISTEEIPTPPAMPFMGPGTDGPGANPYNSANRAENGTIAMDGRKDFDGGGTKFL